MSYSKFTDENVFSDLKVNVLCNRILEALNVNFDSKTIDNEFCLTGTVAKIIQGDALTPVPVIAFITKDADIYNYCKSKLPKYIGATAVIYQNRIQLNYKGIYLEIWKTDNLGTVNIITGLAVQDKTDIPSNIL